MVMSYPAVAGRPPALEGRIVEPSGHIAPLSASAHDFLNVMRALIHRHPWHHENQKLEALNAVAAFEKHFVPPNDLRNLASENDHAPIEDVSQRIPPQTGLAPVVAPSQNIDYDALAAAIVRAQAAQARGYSDAGQQPYGGQQFSSPQVPGDSQRVDTPVDERQVDRAPEPQQGFTPPPPPGGYVRAQ